ncbi:MAG: hypothetical protein A3H69_02790 [Candidatus Sungbacteria bacterium RIFCSPLOWO2_02_FULL_47_9]|nr:MAG: Transcriptional regulator, XRE family [Parcubacteria group bacterium GW2011_GWA2_47_10]OGZ99552.1 MAG: hypothetical protein A3D57_00395 [Candidatus Sungbacteria bacterium RIFCSPHIGHO2_02_FULL_46_12]OHA09956.1 MAG: hypothetical protein A3H69_02790 [Candidatus Sungbacteria bacterium RIFCSPLOWO2_02_FULL_47_9]
MSTKISIKELCAFLNEAHKRTYAAGGKKAPPARLNSDDFEYRKGDLVYHDTYFGARDFIGEEIVYKRKTPVWGMNYYGFVLAKNSKEKQIYGFLKKALMQEYKSLIPVRGPKIYESNAWQYKNSPTGGLGNFSGKEEILVRKKVIYRCLYHGGFI